MAKLIVRWKHLDEWVAASSSSPRQTMRMTNSHLPMENLRSLIDSPFIDRCNSCTGLVNLLHLSDALESISNVSSCLFSNVKEESGYCRTAISQLMNGMVCSESQNRSSSPTIRAEQWILIVSLVVVSVTNAWLFAKSETRSTATKRITKCTIK